MDLHDGDKRSVKIICLGLFRVENFDRICSTRDSEDGATEEVLRELLGIKSRGSNDEFQVRSALDSL